MTETHEQFMNKMVVGQMIYKDLKKQNHPLATLIDLQTDMFLENLKHQAEQLKKDMTCETKKTRGCRGCSSFSGKNCKLGKR